MKNLTPAMALALCANFGSVESWRTAFAAAAGAGEMRLVFSPSDGRLLNRRKDAATSAPGDAVPLLTLSGTSPAQTDAALAVLDWAEPYERYQHAVHAASESFGAQRGDIAAALLLDVRRAGVYAQSAVTLPGARWLDPARVAEWSADLPRSREIVVYCVYGHEVSRATALRLRALGLAARYLHGGIDGWQATGLPLTRKDGSV